MPDGPRCRPRPSTEERLQVVLLEAARARGRLDDSFVSLFDEVLVGFLDKFTIVKKLADDLVLPLEHLCWFSIEEERVMQ